MPDLRIEYRPMAAGDVDGATYVRKAALEALSRSQGRTPSEWQPARYPHFEHLLGTDPEGAWAAIADGTLVGYSMGFTRGSTWFLAQLFVQPEVHARGMGRELLRRAMDAGRARGAVAYSVVSSTSPVAQSLYMQAGMFAAGIGYRVNGPVSALTACPAPGGNRKIITDCSGWQERVADLDARVWSAPRTQDHQLYLRGDWRQHEHMAFGLNHDRELLGYGYCSADGRLGPLASGDPPAQLELLRIAGDWLAERGVSEANAYVLSTNPTVLGALLAGGWRIDGWTFFLTSAPFGQFDRYVPGGGLLL